MEHIYIKFKVRKSASQSEDKPMNWVKKNLRKFVKTLTTIIPTANPDFDDKIDDVNEWLIEIDEETGEPKRELGVDSKGQTIAIMPFNRNYGYWTDLNLNLDDFVDDFNATRIESKEFNNRWDRFATGRTDLSR